MFCDKKVIIWDLDNTLYRITPEIADTLDETMAEALVEETPGRVVRTLCACSCGFGYGANQ